MIFYGKIKELSFKPNNIRAWLDFLENNDDKKVVIEIELEKSKRTLDQNALYWSYLEIIEKETGNLATDLHELFKRKFLPPIQKKILGIDFKIPSTTTNLSKVEFMDYMDKISSFTEIEIPVKDDEFKIDIAYPKNNLGEIPF